MTPANVCSGFRHYTGYPKPTNTVFIRELTQDNADANLLYYSPRHALPCLPFILRVSVNSTIGII